MQATATPTIAVLHRTERTTRDRELLRYVGRHGAVSIEHAMAALGAGRTATYRRVAACIERGLLERLELLRFEPALLRATRDGLRYAGLALPVAVVSPGSVEHWLRCATVAQLLAAEFGEERLLTERELRAAERIEERPLASARLGERALHRPDLAVMRTAEGPGVTPSANGLARPEHPRTRERGREIVGDGERAPAGAEEMRLMIIAIEVELTPKAPRRLEQIVRAWRRASWVTEVRYYCAPGTTQRAVQRAVAKTHSEEKVRILEAPPR
ncbi:MAG: hypothetical protein WB507_00510 [Solirubrobacterales bacterium]